MSSTGTPGSSEPLVGGPPTIAELQKQNRMLQRTLQRREEDLQDEIPDLSEKLAAACQVQKTLQPSGNPTGHACIVAENERLTLELEESRREISKLKEEAKSRDLAVDQDKRRITNDYRRIFEATRSSADYLQSRGYLREDFLAHEDAAGYEDRESLPQSPGSKSVTGESFPLTLTRGTKTRLGGESSGPQKQANQSKADVILREEPKSYQGPEQNNSSDSDSTWYVRPADKWDDLRNFTRIKGKAPERPTHYQTDPAATKPSQTTEPQALSTSIAQAFDQGSAQPREDDTAIPQADLSSSRAHGNRVSSKEGDSASATPQGVIKPTYAKAIQSDNPFSSWREQLEMVKALKAEWYPDPNAPAKALFSPTLIAKQPEPAPEPATKADPKPVAKPATKAKHEPSSVATNPVVDSEALAPATATAVPASAQTATVGSPARIPQAAPPKPVLGKRKHNPFAADK
ncbi:MAG: hypothetical protein Q9211_005915, partial [Gyalolechia sp. 1 TL-2023]